MTTTSAEIPAPQQSPPGSEEQMQPRLTAEDAAYVPGGKLEGKVAIITAGIAALLARYATSKIQDKCQNIFLSKCSQKRQ